MSSEKPSQNPEEFAAERPRVITLEASVQSDTLEKQKALIGIKHLQQSLRATFQQIRGIAFLPAEQHIEIDHGNRIARLRFELWVREDYANLVMQYLAEHDCSIVLGDKKLTPEEAEIYHDTRQNFYEVWLLKSLNTILAQQIRKETQIQEEQDRKEYLGDEDDDAFPHY